MIAASVGAVAAFVLAAVFVVSAVAKLAGPAAWKAQAAGLGVAGPIAAVVPYVEAALAAWLVVRRQPHLAGWAAVALLGAFSVLLGVRLAQGRRPPCACFGSWSSRPIGAGHLARNAALLALAVTVAVA